MEETYLVGGRRDLGVGEDLLLEHTLRGVGHADRAHFALLHHRLHLLPCIAQRPVADEVTVAVRERRDEVVVAFRVQVHGPVDEVDWRRVP